MKKVKTITIFNTKGGSGKSTLAMNLWGAYCLKHYKTFLLDADPQGSISKFAALAKSSMSSSSHSEPYEQIINIASLEALMLTRSDLCGPDSAERLIIDTQGADTDLSRAALYFADLVIVPVNVSPIDFSELPGVIGLVRTAGHDKDIIIVLNRRTFQFGDQSLQSIDDLTDHYKADTHILVPPTLGSVIPNSTVFSKCFADGRTIFSAGGVPGKTMVEVKKSFCAIHGWCERRLDSDMNNLMASNAALPL